MQLQDAIEKRHSAKRFSTKKPDWRDILECLNTARFTPMAGNNFTLKFVFVDDPKSIQKLAQASQQEFIQDAQYIIVVCSNPARTIKLYGNRGEIYSRQQAGAAIQNILLSLTEKKLSTCWIGHFVESQIKKELGIPEGIDIEALLPIGYEFGKIKKSSKIDFDKLVYFKTWGNKRMKPIPTVNV